MNQDTKFKNTHNDRRRLIRITARMGAGKTTSVLEFVMDQLHRGNIESAAYVAPRKMLVHTSAKKASFCFRESNCGDVRTCVSVGPRTPK